MNRFFRALPSLLKETAIEWKQDNAMRLAAALAYYTAFSLAPLWIAILAMTGAFIGRDAAEGQLFEQLQSAVGPSAAQALEELSASASKPATSISAGILATGLALFGASGVFGELKQSLNQIWGLAEKTGNGIWLWIRGRFLSIGMVIGVAFLLLVSMMVNTILTLVAEEDLASIPGHAVAMQALSQSLTLTIITVIFSALFRYLPSTRIGWRDVWVGGVVTSVLFSFGKFGLEQYLARAAPGNSFGAASSLALILVWIYYSAQIFLFGAEFTEVYSRRLGTRSRCAAPRSKRD
ncbi:MAG: YihY/virulence factor BrkB family protein [Verrucomicrobiae bacterium]|nr:YihY/virulence factor BrkB family protein [Verrucomicrobiae bacterium]